MTDERDDLDDLDTVTSEDFDGFEMVPTALHLGGGVSSQALHTWLCLRRYATMREQRAVPTRERIAGDIGKSPRAVDGYLDELVHVGFLLITPRARTSGSQASNLHEVLVRPILTADDPRLVRHMQRVARFEAEHGRRSRAASWDEAAARECAARYTARIAPIQQAPKDKTAGQPRVAETCEGGSSPLRGGVAESCEGGWQSSATLESDSLELEEVELEEPLSADADDVDPVGQLMILTVTAPPPPSFEEFWSAYPRHVKRAPSKAKWDQLVRDGHDPAEIVAGARAYAEWCRAEGKPEQFIAHPSSWLNARRWTDVLVRSTPDPGPARMTAPDRRLALAQDTLARLRAREARSESRALAFPPTAPTALEAAR